MRLAVFVGWHRTTICPVLERRRPLRIQIHEPGHSATDDR